MTKRKLKVVGSDVGVGDEVGQNPFLVTCVERVVRTYRCRLWGPYNSSEDFLHTIEALELAEEDDIVELHISGPGGSLDALITLLHAMDKCKGHVHAVGTGMIASAATFPVICADSYELHPHTSFLLHMTSFGVWPQKSRDTVAEAVFNDKQSEAFIREYYAGMLNEEEMLELLHGKQFYMDAHEFADRYNRRNGLLEAQAIEKDDETTH